MQDFNSTFFATEILNKRKQQSFLDLKNRENEVFAKISNYKPLSLKINEKGAALALAKFKKDEVSVSKLKIELEELLIERKKLLLDNNFSENYLELHHFCNICSDNGYINGVLCSCMKNENAKQKQIYLSSLSPMPTATFDDFSLDYYPKEKSEDGTDIYEHMQKIFNFSKEYANKFTPKFKGILMMGTAGLGKTHLSCAIAKECMNKGFSVIYTSSQTLFDSIDKNRYSQDDELIHNIANCDLFILDDLGSEYLTNYSISSFYNIINNRTIKNLPTIYTSNLKTQQEIYQRYPEKIASRILGTNHILIFKGNDIRLIKK